MERVAASRIVEEAPWLEATSSPKGFKGLVLISGCRGGEDRIILEKVPEADKVLVVHARARAVLEDLQRASVEAVKGRISSGECFAVRTVRRGRHSFTSIDVNVAVGDAVKRATGACVNLSRPDKIVAVEILQDEALISVYPGSMEWRKHGPGKAPLHRFFRRFSIVQMPYLGPLDACRNMGVRIGREVQNFEVSELVVAPAGMVDGDQLLHFLQGIFEGIESRYKIQEKSYSRRPWRVPVRVQDLHQLVRDRRGEPIIVFEPEGEPVSRLREDLWRLLKGRRRVNLLFGSREGIPPGVYRFADLVVDLAPGITLSTEYAASSALIALATILYEDYLGEEGRVE
ncbi:MAG: SPOUT family RNA methylase [Desulfurococcales archaeon]|nr:SPOUT family RNA methylase [Desulfurococcales archaeon]MCE4605452.1 SPOUT family RNA methylase [Desulfurococcales archaeon]